MPTKTIAAFLYILQWLYTRHMKVVHQGSQNLVRQVRVEVMDKWTMNKWPKKIQTFALDLVMYENYFLTSQTIYVHVTSREELVWPNVHY